jgi:reactive chlorine resistance protein C
VLLILWMGAMKFAVYKANGIPPLVANSPLMGWLYRFLSVQEFSDSLGVSIWSLGESLVSIGASRN